MTSIVETQRFDAHLRARVAQLAAAVGFAMLIGLAFRSTAGAEPPPATWVPAAAPAGIDAPGAAWMLVDAPGGQLLTAAFRPSGAGPFPLVVVYHGGTGLFEGHVQLASFFAQHGFMAVTGCWFGPGAPTGPAAVGQKLDCTQAPNPAQHDAQAGAWPLLSAARSLPDVRSDAVGLYGMSLGGTEVLLLASHGAGVQAVVTDAARSTEGDSPVPVPLPLDSVGELSARLFMFHQTGDPVVPGQQTPDYAAAAQAAGVHVEVHMYEGERHTVENAPEIRDDARQRSLEFFSRYLGR